MKRRRRIYLPVGSLPAGYVADLADGVAQVRDEDGRCVWEGWADDEDDALAKLESVALSGWEAKCSNPQCYSPVLREMRDGSGPVYCSERCDALDDVGRDDYRRVGFD